MMVRVCPKHEFILCYSTFGADQGAMCKHCWTNAPWEVYKRLKKEELKAQIKSLDSKVFPKYK